MRAQTAAALVLLLAAAGCERAAAPKRADYVAARFGRPSVLDTASPIELTRRVGVAGGMAPVASIAAPSPQPADAAANAEITAQDIAPGSMLVRLGQASLQVDSLDVGIARVRDVARRTGAIVANTSMEGGHDRTRAASLQLRIPSQRFDEAVNALGPIGKLESVNVTVQDVGEEYVDVQARVANARRLEQRLVDLLATRTGKLSDVLSVERELARVREEIERYEGRTHYLQSRASVSTLTVGIHEPYPVIADRPGARPMRDAFVQAWRNLVGFTAGFIELLGVFVPLGVLALVIVLAVRRFVPSMIPRLSAGRTTSEQGRA